MTAPPFTVHYSFSANKIHKMSSINAKHASGYVKDLNYFKRSWVHVKTLGD